MAFPKNTLKREEYSWFFINVSICVYPLKSFGKAKFSRFLSSIPTSEVF